MGKEIQKQVGGEIQTYVGRSQRQVGRFTNKWKDSTHLCMRAIPSPSGTLSRHLQPGRTGSPGIEGCTVGTDPTRPNCHWQALVRLRNCRKSSAVSQESARGNVPTRGLAVKMKVKEAFGPSVTRTEIIGSNYSDEELVCLFGFLTSSSATRLYRGGVSRLTSDNFTCCHTRDRAGRP